MELRALRHLVAVHDTGSASAAARVLHLTQPAVSRSVAALEREVGVPLFERSGGPLVPTSACLQLLPVARDLLTRADAAQRLFRALPGGSGVRFRVACPESTVRHVVAPFLADTSAPVGDAYGLPPSAVYPALLGRGTDLAVNTLSPPPALAGRPIGAIGVGAYVRADHPLAAAGGPVRIDELVAYDLVLMGPGSAVRDAVDRALRDTPVTPRIVAEPDSSAMAQALAATGAGVGLTLDPPGYDLVARPLHTADGRPVRIGLWAAWEPSHYAAARLDALTTDLAGWFARRSTRDAGAARWVPAG